MNFFDHQEEARRASQRLVLLFLLALALVVCGVNIGLWILEKNFSETLFVDSENRWVLHLFASLGTLSIISLGSYTKWRRLRQGGGAQVAMDLGGKLVSTNTDDPSERKLLNVVEEMALASGTPVPEVFILEEEGINAFAAGFDPHDAVIGVTRAAIKDLSRDELQGVIAHEFSHIFHGDMNLNMKLLSLLNGLVFLSYLGRQLMGGQRLRRRSRKGSGVEGIGLFLFLLGFIGIIAGRLLQASISRQREFLADASAVQYTRNPEGIAGALKKIFHFAEGAKLKHPQAAKNKHFFLSSPETRSLSGLWSTHPPLAERIRRIDPSFQGTDAKNLQAPIGSGNMAAAGFSTASPSKLNFENSNISPYISQLAQDLQSSQAIAFGIFFHREENLSRQQALVLKAGGSEQLLPEVYKVQSLIEKSQGRDRLRFLELSLPTLKRLSLKQKDDFLRTCKSLIATDQQLHLFEYALFKLLKLQLLGAKDSKAPKKERLKPRHALQVLLSALIHAGEPDYRKAQALFKNIAPKLEMLPEQNCHPRAIELALDTFIEAPPRLKQSFIELCRKALLPDSALQMEIFAAFCESLGIPRFAVHESPPLPPKSRAG